MKKRILVMDNYNAVGSADVSAFLRAFFSFVKNIISYIISSLRKYFLPALAVFVLVMAAAYYFRSIQKPFYESQMVCEFVNVTKKSIGEEIVKLDKLVKSGSYTALAKTLQISEQQASQIISIDAKNIVGSPLQEDVTKTANPIYITVKAGSNTVFAPLQAALLNYLNNVSPFRARRDTMELEILDNTIAFLNHDIRQTDSIIAAYSKFLSRTRAVTDSAAGFSNVAALLKYKADLQAKHAQNLWRKKELVYKVELLHGFLPTDFPTQNAGLHWFVVVLCGLAASSVTSVGLNLLRTKTTVPAEEAGGEAEVAAI